MKIDKGLLLLSAGIDSPVAGYKMKKLGVNLSAITFHYIPLADETNIEKAKKLAKVLGIKKLYVLPFAKVQEEVVKKCEHKYFYLITRRIMWRVAEKIAKQEGYKCLITGENLGQVSSQTLTNMTLIAEAVELPILRPLLGNDKQETINEAIKIGTYEISKGPEICCILGPKHPVTKGNKNILLKEEKKIDINSIIYELLNQQRQHSLR